MFETLYYYSDYEVIMWCDGTGDFSVVDSLNADILFTGTLKGCKNYLKNL